ncbi:MAG: pyridoxal phosphate-dependent aminotransferase [bacterium]|jgi:aspartate/methionine/tyrosine aminotransferase|nr:pyridoxal phosphate-dependent aminotransferase [bacterium]
MALPLSREQVLHEIESLGYHPDRLAIRELRRLVEHLEVLAGEPFIRMEFGVPNLPVPQVAVDAEIEAIRTLEVQRSYPPFDGIPILKEECVHFVRNFVGIEVPPDVCMPTCGAMQGGFVSLILGARMVKGRDTVLFLDPGFPVNKMQARFFGLKSDSIDFYDHRGARLIKAVDERLARGDVGAVIWSSPNNPAWICLTQEELDGLALCGDRHDVLFIEDAAYFGMDLRQDVFHPGEPPYQPSVARCGHTWVLLLSGSKLFSFAGQRVGMMVVSPTLAARRFENFLPYFGTDRFLHAFIHGGIYCSTAGVTHSGQHALAALLRMANEGDRSFLDNVREYASRAAWLKACFLRHGFRLVYDNDLGQPIADGFYFTICRPGLSGTELQLELLRHGISMITLEITGSSRHEGLRACVSFTGHDQFERVEGRLEALAREQGR